MAINTPIEYAQCAGEPQGVRDAAVLSPNDRDHPVTPPYSAKHVTHLDEWRRMGEAGIFPHESRVVPINGEIIEMPPIGFHHAGHAKRITR